jgi:propanol-preferring alcohol dehydrogenase
MLLILIVPQERFDDFESRTGFRDANLRPEALVTWGAGHELLAEAAAIPIRPHTTVYPLADANRALLDLKSDRINGTGVLQIAEF